MRKPAPAARPRSRAPAAAFKVPAIGETEFHLQAAALLRAGVPKGGGFYHVPNQGKRSPVTGNLFKAMGMRPGMTDLVLTAAVPYVVADGFRPRFTVSAAGYLELKAGKGTLRPDQLAFRDECLALGVPWGEARTLPEVEAFAVSFYAAFGLTFRATLGHRQ